MGVEGAESGSLNMIFLEGVEMREEEVTGDLEADFFKIEFEGEAYAGFETTLAMNLDPSKSGTPNSAPYKASSRIPFVVVVVVVVVS